MKKTKRPTEQELLHRWLEGDLDLTQQLYVEKDEPQPEAVEPYQPKRDRDTFLRSLRRSLRLYNVLAFLLCGYYGAHLFIEVQARYRYFLMPVLFLLAGAGAQLVLAWWQGRKNSGAKTPETP